jgi:hypothetical protein
LSEAHETRYRIRLQAEVALIKNKMGIVPHWVDIIKITPSKQIIEALKIVGYDYDLDPADPHQFNLDIKHIEAEIRAEKLDLRVKEAEYEAIKNSTNTSDAVERKYFTTIFTRINNHCKRDAVNMQTTVEMYCAALRSFVADIEAQKTTK